MSQRCGIVHHGTDERDHLLLPPQFFALYSRPFALPSPGQALPSPRPLSRPFQPPRPSPPPTPPHPTRSSQPHQVVHGLAAQELAQGGPQHLAAVSLGGREGEKRAGRHRDREGLKGSWCADHVIMYYIRNIPPNRNLRTTRGVRAKVTAGGRGGRTLIESCARVPDMAHSPLGTTRIPDTHGVVVVLVGGGNTGGGSRPRPASELDEYGKIVKIPPHDLTPLITPPGGCTASFPRP